jgi:branched-chain amino acid aminotransferase
MLIYLNGQIIPSEKAVISIFDHGFLYGDGIYETMRSYNGVVFKIEKHIKRLKKSASLISLSLPFSEEILKRDIYETLHANSLLNAYIRITISRGKGDIGIDPELCKKPTIVIITKEFNGYPERLYKEGIKLIIAKTRRNHKNALNPQIKSLNFLNNILAKVEAKKEGAYEALMLNVYGKIAEGTISNVFFIKDNTIMTPSTKCGILNGITRQTVIEMIKKENLNLKQGFYTKEDIYSADEVFITNTTMEIMPVSMIDKKKYKVGKYTNKLRKLYKKEVELYIDQHTTYNIN